MRNDIESNIVERVYQSPGRARSAISRSQLPPKSKARMFGLVDKWEAEGASEPPVVGGLAEAESANGTNDVRVHPPVEVINGARRLLRSGNGDQLAVPLGLPLVLNLNVRIRAQLTPYGVSLLYAARSKVIVPDDLLSSGGVWETSLAEFMIVMGPYLSTDADTPTLGFTIELLRLTP